MITMSRRDQDGSRHPDFVFGDGFNLERGYEEFHSSDSQGDPYVLTTLRNVFSEVQTEEYEMVYDFNQTPEPNIPNVPENSHHQNVSDPPPPPPPRIPVPKVENHEEEDEEDEDIRGVYPCTKCNKKYTCERRLKHHLVTHENKDAYKCPKCGYCYQSPDSLKRHLKKTTDCTQIPPRHDAATSNF